MSSLASARVDRSSATAIRPDVLRDFVAELHARVEGFELWFGHSRFDVLAPDARDLSGFYGTGRFAVDGDRM
jgi:hypothetical protein